MNVLIIIDPQIDFIRGALPVPQAESTMHYLAQWMIEHKDEYDSVFISMDQHPIDHCSFREMGGAWPRHCVRYSLGAAIDEGILASIAQLRDFGKSINYIEKATERDKDEYSAFAKNIPQEILSAEKIFLSGLAGDFCVEASQQDLLRYIPLERIERLEQGIAWINPNHN